MLHGPTISAIEDRSSVRDERRAEIRFQGQIAAMSDDAWRERIEAAIQKDGRSYREVSLAAGLSHGYVHGILKDDKEPTLDRFIRLCQVLNLSVSYALLGANISRQAETLISAIEENPQARDAILALLAKPEEA